MFDSNNCLNDWNDVSNTYTNIIGHKDLAMTIFGYFLLIIDVNYWFN